MPVNRIPFDLRLTKVAATGDNDLETDVVERGWLMNVQRVEIENKTSNYTSIRILKRSAGAEFTIAFQDTVLAETPDWYDEPIWLTEGQSLVVRMAGCTANDALEVCLSGYRQSNESFKGAM